MNFGDPRVPDRVWEKCTLVMPGGCWRWNGSISGGPQVRMRGRTCQVKRLLYEIANGPTKHPCVGGCSKNCVNPDHQVAGTHEDINAAYWADHPLSPTCRHDHDRAAVGEYVYDRHGRIFRVCRACQAIHMRRWRERRRRRRIRRMSPARRAAFKRRSTAMTKLWKRRRRVPVVCCSERTS